MRLVILGAGGYGRVIADLARQSQRFDEIIFLDDHNGNAAGVCDTFSAYIDSDTEFYPAFGNNEIRMRWLKKLKDADVSVCSLIHASAYVSPTAKIGNGTMVLPHACIGTDAAVGEGCIINMHAVVDHDCVIENGVHVCLGAIVKSAKTVRENTKVEAGQVIA